MRGADAVIRALEKEGVKYIAGFSGGGLNPLWEPLRTSDSIKVFATRHERLGVEIADGYARATQSVGVAMTGTGPGATNTLTGIAGCFADNIPVLLLMGQHPLRNLGKEYQQEVSSSIFDGLVKWKGTFTRVDDIPGVMRRAFQLRPGLIRASGAEPLRSLGILLIPAPLPSAQHAHLRPRRCAPRTSGVPSPKADALFFAA